MLTRTWEDVFTMVIPITSLMVNARFVMDAATEIFNEIEPAVIGAVLTH